MKNKNRKPSWLYLDRALKIQFPPKHLSKKLALIFLSAKADDHGRSYHGYRSICAHLGFGSKSTLSEALKYLRDELGILTWKHGAGGFEKKDTNHYELNLEVMSTVIAAQGLFDPETGKLKRYEVESIECTQSGTPDGLSVESTQAKVESTEGKVESTQDTGRVHSLYRNPQEPPEKSNPQNGTMGSGSLFSAPCAPSRSDGSVGQRLAKPPSCATPPESSHKTRTECAPGSAVTDKFINDHTPTKSRKEPKTALELAKGIRTALEREAPDAPILKSLAYDSESQWCTSLGFAITKKLASLDELRMLARFAMDHKLPELLNYGAPGLVGSLGKIRELMKEQEVRS